MYNKKYCIALVMGSRKDWIIMKHAAHILNELNLLYTAEIISAHRTPDKLLSFAENSVKFGYKVIIAGAGGAAHLPGMIASKTILPVLGVPIPSTPLSGLDSLYSIVQMPKGTPVGTLSIGKPGAINAAILAAEILAIYDIELANRLISWRKNQTNIVLNNPDPRM